MFVSLGEFVLEARKKKRKESDANRLLLDGLREREVILKKSTMYKIYF